MLEFLRNGQCLAVSSVGLLSFGLRIWWFVFRIDTRRDLEKVDAVHTLAVFLPISLAVFMLARCGERVESWSQTDAAVSSPGTRISTAFLLLMGEVTSDPNLIGVPVRQVRRAHILLVVGHQNCHGSVPCDVGNSPQHVQDAIHSEDKGNAHAGDTDRLELGISDGLVCLSVSLEATDDFIEDLEQTLAA